MQQVETIFEDLSSACEQLGITLAGGHTEITFGLDRPIIAGHMLGEAWPDRLVSTSGMRLGDDIILTKAVAVEATALIAREKQDELRTLFPPEYLERCRQFLHEPGISVVRDAQTAQSAGKVNALMRRAEESSNE